MERVFISHSSIQKDFVTCLAEAIGQDRCIIDCYDFRSSEKLEEEIKRKIEQSGIFCLLISDAALNSDWVQKEIQYVRERVNDNTILFRAFIIESGIYPDDTRITPWVKGYLLHTIPSPQIIGRVLSENLREIDYKNYPLLELRDSLFIGRGRSLSDLETEHVLKSRVKTIVVSGIPHVGRKRFALQYLRQITKDTRSNFCIVLLERGKSIEDLAFYLNDFAELYKKEELLKRLVTEDLSRKIRIVVNLINKLYDYHQSILIIDDFCIVHPSGYLVEWFRNILKDANLPFHAGLFIVSKVGVNSKESQQLPIVQQSLLPLENREIQAIVKAYSAPQNLRVPEEDIKLISDAVKGLPSYVFPIIDAWVKHNRFLAFEKMRDLEKSISDLLEYIVDILNDSKNESKIQLLLLLAHFEVISIKQLRELYFLPNLEEILDGFQELSILEFFGYSQEYIRIHPVVADFLKRSKRITLSKEFAESVSIRASEIMRDIDTPEVDEDIVTYLYGIKQVLKKGLSNSRDIAKYMIPSLALNVIVEEYENKNYQGVLTLCRRMLSGTKNYDEHIERSIRYWYCLSLCRLREKELFDAVVYFKGSHTYHFLLGFYYRMQEYWERAEEEYEKALEHDNEGVDNKKVKQELVLVRVKRGDYKGAISLAEENYKRQRFNSFFIEAYFRCLVKDPYSDPSLMKSLISEMEKSQDKNQTEIANTMKAEYAYYFEGDFWKAVQLLQETIEHYPSMKYPLDAFACICKEEKKPQLYREFMKKVGSERNIT